MAIEIVKRGGEQPVAARKVSGCSGGWGSQQGAPVAVVHVRKLILSTIN
jgi:hypothetical protein